MRFLHLVYKILKMAVNHLQSLRTFLLGHPPLVVFTACVFLFGVTTIVLAFIVGRSELPNPDITMDWNVFLTHLTERNLCVNTTNWSELHRPRVNSAHVNKLTNATGNATAAASPEPLVGVEQLSLSELLPDISALKLGKDQSGPSINVTKSMVIPLRFDENLLRLPPSVTWLRGRVTGRYVGHVGKLSKETIHVNMFLPNDLKKETSHCHGKTQCTIHLKVCLVFFGPAAVIPKTGQLKGCRHWTDDVRHAANTTWYLPDLSPKQCAEKVPLKAHYENDPNFTAMLSNIDKSIVNLHLMHTSYLIFIIVITMLCYALVRSHFRNSKILPSEKVNV